MTVTADLPSASAGSDATPGNSRPRTALFTICSNNYLPGARVLLESVRTRHPDMALFVCLADRPDPMPGLYDGPFEIIPADALGIPAFESFAFSYDIMEFNTALKPFMFGHLMTALGFERVLYFDPDILLLAPLEPVLEAFDTGASFVLTPHLRQPAEGDSDPDDVAIMRAGVYNLGFLGVSARTESLPLIYWWQRRLYRHCINAQDKGIFVDQKFMDLIPGFAPNARILHHPGLNLAYWNLGQARLEKSADGWFANDLPLIFFHFSGYDPRRPHVLSKHSRNFRGTHGGPLAELLDHYARLLKAHGHGQIPGGAYAYGRFASDVPIPPLVRQMFRETAPDWPTDPFRTFEAHLHRAAPGANRDRPSLVFTNFQAFLHQHFPNQRLFRDPRRLEDVLGLTLWYLRHFSHEQGIDPRLIEPVARRLGERVPQIRPVPEPAARPDVTVVGYLRTVSGVGMVARHTLSTLVNSPLQVEGADVAFGVVSDRSEHGHDAYLVEPIRGRIQLFANINADQLPLVLADLAPRLVSGYRISMPAWELEEFPEAWLGAFDQVDEIWAQSRWIQRMLAGRVDRPVVHMPVALTLEAPDTTGIRERFGLPADSFLFYNSFDFLSFIERKNPEGVIAAFQAARRAMPERRMTLVIKTLNGAQVSGKQAALRALIEADPDIVMIDRVLSRADTLGLMAACDCLVSLHRCEGLGLLVAEGMALGKPVIATDYAATTDLLTSRTGYPVSFTMIPVGENEYPMAQGQRWADPDVVHAAWQMQEVLRNPADAAERAAAARRFIDEHHSERAVRERQLARFTALGLLS
jgi:glycosyltransferase involved in cell wall biosynthesis